jgi:hypothetical protein
VPIVADPVSRGDCGPVQSKVVLSRSTMPDQAGALAAGLKELPRGQLVWSRLPVVRQVGHGHGCLAPLGEQLGLAGGKLGPEYSLLVGDIG